jgi:hypothetical protein
MVSIIALRVLGIGLTLYVILIAEALGSLFDGLEILSRCNLKSSSEKCSYKDDSLIDFIAKRKAPNLAEPQIKNSQSREPSLNL